jgi:hypothetical protein
LPADRRVLWDRRRWRGRVGGERSRSESGSSTSRSSAGAAC